MVFKCAIWVTLVTITLLITVLCKVSHATTCSGTVRELADVGRRGPMYIISSSSEPTISDSTLPSGWYVAKDSVRYYTMVNGTAPRYAYCGTDNPIYIKDKIGKLEDGKEYQHQACLVDYDSDCKQRYDVKIRRCGQEIQYHLLPTDGTSAYCFEPSSLTVVAPAPNYRIPGRIQVSVALMYKRASKSSEPELEFKCNFASGNNRYFYGVNWVINGRIEKTFTPVKMKDVDNTILNETTIRTLGFSFGISIQCAVRVSTTATGNQTSPQMSDTFYAGVKVLNPRIQLGSGRSASISLQPTIPLGCRRPYALPAHRQESCSVDIEMFDPNSNYSCKDTSVSSISNQKLCGSSLTGWRNTDVQTCMHQHNIRCTYTGVKSYLRSQAIRISITNDQLQYPKDKIFTLQLKTGNIAPHTFWKNARIDDVTIIYTGGSQNLEWRGRSCYVINDPSLKVFDINRVTYMKEIGHYLLYNNTKHSTQVQIKTHHCSDDSTASCTCAVAIQAGGDVFLIDICDRMKRASFVHCRGDVLNVREVTSKDYEVFLPTGTKIKVVIRNWYSDFLKVYIYPSPSDVRNTEGLCGNLNGRQDEVLNSSHFFKWRLQQSLFNTVRYNLPPTWTYDHNVCICPRALPGVTQQTPGSQSNGVKDARAVCFSQQYATCTDNINLQGERKVCTIRNKRSVERHQRNIERLLALSVSNKSSNDRIRKSTKHVQLTEEQAYQECLDVFKSKPTYSMKDDLPSISLTESLSACVNDMVVDGQEFWKEESYDSWASVISQEIGRNGTFRKENENIVHRFRNVTCPSQCHGNGDCINGTCVCKDDYVGDSCFVKRSAPLELTDIEGGGECDLAHGDDCHECLQFHTVNLLKGFKCKIETHDLDENGTVVQSDEQKRSGEYESIFDGYCCPSAAEKRRRRSLATHGFTVRYSISISNDGMHFGPSRNVHVFDSRCQTYFVAPNGEWIFNLKEDTCYINGQCYRNGDRSIASPDLTCCHLVTKFAWTTRQDCVSYEGQARKTSVNDKTVIVAVSVSVTGLLIVACVVVFVIWTYKSKKRTVSSTKAESEKKQDYDKLYFGNQPVNTKFHSGGKSAIHQSNLDNFVTDYEQLRK